jgi:Transposase DDE domain group 1
VLASKLEAVRPELRAGRRQLDAQPRRAITRLATIPAAIESLFVTFFPEAHKTPPPEITLDLDTTDDPLHGHQDVLFYHGYYDC